MWAKSLEATPVVTAFLCRQGRVLLLRRSERVATHRGRWSGVSGYLEQAPLAQARVELREEAGVGGGDIALRGIGVPMLVDDREAERPWLVFTFLFRLRRGARVTTDWESVASAWVRPEELEELDTVPGLAEGLRRVWPPWGGERFWQAIEDIALDTVTGATGLALRGLRAAGRLRGESRVRGLKAFSALRPSMGVFPHLAARALSEPLRLTGLARELETAAIAAASRAAEALRRSRRVLTHSASRACLEALLQWRTAGAEVVVTESRPKREGLDMARQLTAAGARVTVISDAAMGLFVPRCSAVLVGADAIGEHGELVNKAGTRLAVLAARDAGVPAYAVTQTHKICPSGWPLSLAPQSPGDLARVSRARVANIAFDATPMRWFAAVLTERGKLTPRLLRSTAAALRVDW